MSARPRFVRHPENPIVVPGGLDFRRAVTFNPGAIQKGGKVYLIERAASTLRPFICQLGLLSSDDGVHFTHEVERPILTPADVGSEYGSVQDPRVVELEGRYAMTFAYRPYAWSSHPTGVGVPDSHQTDFPGFDGDAAKNLTRSGIAVSDDLVTWQLLGLVTPPDIDDRDVILFPRKVGGRYALLRRPMPPPDPNHKVAPVGSLQLSYGSDLLHWSDPIVIAEPKYAWEGTRIGGSVPPIETPHGWLCLHHGVERVDEARRAVVYRLGAMLLELEEPSRVIARAPDFILEPEEYYERFGLYIPNVVFPSGAIVKDGVLSLYYGVCDTAIALATTPLEPLVDWVRSFPA
jgi:beta-1,2-mannobiose phosphorylase / 1,2-beta-oligomannan phosphorylase